MRIVGWIIVSAAVGTVLGVALAYYQIGPAQVELPAITASPQTASPAPASVGKPVVKVDEPDYDFGTMQLGTTNSHMFVFRNVGDKPLQLKVGRSTCKCTIGNVPEKPIPPGESVDVNVEWTAHVSRGEFRQTAVVLTNDPLHSRVELNIHGIVTEVSGLNPSAFQFGTISPEQTASVLVYLMSFAQEDLKIAKAELADKSLREFFDVRIEPASIEELPEPGAKAGLKITLTTKPGLPAGRFADWLRLQTNLHDTGQLDVLVQGRVVGDVSVFGRGWINALDTLAMGRVLSSDGAERTLNIVVRGDSAEDAQFEVVRCDPDVMVATLGTPRRPKEGLLHVPLVIEVPPGTREMARLGNQQSEAGKVVLKTSLPGQPELEINVQFTVEQ